MRTSGSPGSGPVAAALALGRRLRARGGDVALRALGVTRGGGFYDDAPSASTLARLAALRLRNLRSRTPVTGDGDAVVVMTTIAPRITLVWAAIESIAAGGVRPRRLVLSLDDPSLTLLPSSLRRLERRGLEIRHVAPGLGVHTKWWPYVEGEAQHRLPVATSDDDQLYPRTWLAQLLAGAASHPDAVIAHRAHRIRIEHGTITPYVEWRRASNPQPSYANFGTSVSGQLLPVALLQSLRQRGTAFLELAPKADDVWLHGSAVRAGLRIAQVSAESKDFPFVPGTQTSGLYLDNVLGAGNDRQLAAVLGPAERERIIADGS